MLLEATPHEGGAMQTPSIAPMGGSPGLPVSPLMAADTVLFTPSSRKLLRSMAHNPFDMPLDMSTGLTPPWALHQTPAGAADSAGAVAAAGGSAKRSKAAADGFDTPARAVRGCDREKPTATRRLVFGQAAGAETAGDGDVALSSAVPGLPLTGPALASAEEASAVAAVPMFESPLKRSRVQPADDAGAPHARPLFVAAAGEAPASVCLPDTPGRDHVRTALAAEPRCDAAAQLAALAKGGSSTGRTSAASTADVAQLSQDSSETHDKSAGSEGERPKAVGPLAQDTHTDSLQLKSKLNSIVDAMFVC